MEGFPGANSSFSYSSKYGRAHHSANGRAIAQDFASKWGKCDTIGCGYDKRKRIIFFTLNGKFLTSPFEEIDARFHPMVWIESPGCQVRINFGHDPFVYDFEATLPSDYMESLRRESVLLSPIERKRRTKAEDLVQLMGNYPIEVCTMALEQVHDDMQAAAN